MGDDTEGVPHTEAKVMSGSCQPLLITYFLKRSGWCALQSPLRRDQESAARVERETGRRM